MKLLLAACVLFMLMSGCVRHSVIVGRFSPEAFADTVRTWRDVWGSRYRPQDQAALQQLAQADTFSLMAFCATWCHDSRREVPRLLHLSKLMAVNRLEIVTLDTARTHRDPEDLYLKHQVKFTPTFILFRKGAEIGRIVERPPDGQTLEAALAAIVHP